MVANARRLRFLCRNRHKSDKLDTENLARIARMDPRLLVPLRHLDEASQAHLALLRSHEVVSIGARTQLVNHVGGVAKSFGDRLPTCSAASFMSAPHARSKRIMQWLLLDFKPPRQPSIPESRT
jgi:transposase